MTEQQESDHFVPWVNRAAFPIVSAAFYSCQAVLAYSVSQGWMWLTIPLVLVLSHLMHGLLIAFHETTHGSLRKHRLANDIDGVLMGVMTYTSFTLYRALHQKHHVNLATEKDIELWPFVDPTSPLWARRLAAFIELNFGMFFIPFLFWRGFFTKDSAIRNPKVRRRIWAELVLTIVLWGVVIGVVAYFGLWPYYFFNYLIPGFIAGNLQSWRKYIEHIGLNGNTPRSATRSIVADTLAGRAMSVTLLHEPLHGIHHIRSGLPHFELPQHTEWLDPSEEGDTAPFPNYRTAFKDLIQRLPDPRVGGQWNAVEASDSGKVSSQS